MRDGFIEVACVDCRKRTGEHQILHRFDPTGYVVETIVIHQP